MKKTVLLMLTLMIFSSLAFGQTVGSVSGTVRDSLDNPVGGAMIDLMGIGGHHHHNYHAQSDSAGAFIIPQVEAGSYMATASKMMVGHDRDSIEVVADQNTAVDFVLVMNNPPPPPPPPPPTETGSVSGIVRDTLDNPIAGAMIRLDDADNHRGRHHDNYMTQTAEDGTFSIGNVAVGFYTAMASKVGIGHDIERIEVADSENTVVDFVLVSGGHDGHHRGDSLDVVELAGWAIVVTDSLRSEYFLDTNADDTSDYRLLFGPSWYDPGNGAARPNDGDSIWITGGLMGYSQPQAVVVYEINGLFWRQPGRGHGGHGGHGGGCPHPDSVTLIETSGLAIVNENPMMDHYFLDTNYDDTADYVLVFGPPWYNPDNGATRPEDGDSITIVGGLLEGPDGHLDHIIVYEINGQEWWRTPGDTISLWAVPLSVNDSQENLPASYLVASSYPNPFNPAAVISFSLTQSEHVKVTVYDLLGREIAVLANGIYPAGANQVKFDAGSMAGSSAVYFYRVETGSEVATGKMVLLK